MKITEAQLRKLVRSEIVKEADYGYRHGTMDPDAAASNIASRLPVQTAEEVVTRWQNKYMREIGVSEQVKMRDLIRMLQNAENEAL